MGEQAQLRADAAEAWAVFAVAAADIFRKAKAYDATISDHDATILNAAGESAEVSFAAAFDFSDSQNFNTYCANGWAVAARTNAELAVILFGLAYRTEQE